MYRNVAVHTVDRFYGSICYRPSALETFRSCDDLYPDRHDDTGTLCVNSFVYSLRENGSDKQSNGSYDTLSDVLASDNNIYHDRFFPKYTQ